MDTVTVADTRLQIPEFLRPTFDRNLPELRNRLVTLHELLYQLFTGQDELLPQCIKGFHDLAGSLGVFGLSSTSESASRIEAMLRNHPSVDASQIDIIRKEINYLRTILEV